MELELTHFDFCKWLQVEFFKLVSLGDDSGALRVASSHLGHLAASNPALLKPLKETLLSLLRPKEEAIHQNLPLQALATSLQVWHIPLQDTMHLCF